MSHSEVVQLMGATRTRAGLTVNAKLDKRKYPTNVKVATEEMVSVNLESNAFHGGMELHHQQTEPSEHDKLNVVPILLNRPQGGSARPHPSPIMQLCLFRKAFPDI